MVNYLEKKPYETKVSTGEALVTPENMNEPEISRLIHPPQVENITESSISGAKSKKWRVMVIPKGTSHEFWKTIHAGALKAAQELGNVEVIWQGPQKEDDRVTQIQLMQSAVAAGVDGIVLAPLDAGAGGTSGSGGRQRHSGRDFRFRAGNDQDRRLCGHQQLQRRCAGRRADRRSPER